MSLTAREFTSVSITDVDLDEEVFNGNFYTVSPPVPKIGDKIALMIPQSIENDSDITQFKEYVVESIDFDYIDGRYKIHESAPLIYQRCCGVNIKVKQVE